MRKIAVIAATIAVCSLHSLQAEAKPQYVTEAWNLMLNGATCPIAKFEAIARRAVRAGERAQAADIFGAVASCHAKQGDLRAGARALSRALSLGFGDCAFLRTDADIKKLPNYDAALRKVTISPADMHELTWAMSEVAAIGHDTKLMIIANMNRKDSSSTPVYPTKIPTRPTKNATVMLYRWLLVHMMQNQRMAVLKSDHMRMSHVTNMTIIRNMGSGGSNVRSRLMSLRIAQQQARQRLANVSRRAYRATSLSNRPRSCASFR